MIMHNSLFKGFGLRYLQKSPRKMTAASGEQFSLYSTHAHGLGRRELPYRRGSVTYLPPRCSRASVYRSTCAWWRWADYHIRSNSTPRWAPTLVSAQATWLNKGRSSAQHIDHLTQNRWCLPPTRVAFKHLATAVVAGHLMGRVRLATPAMFTTHQCAAL